MTFYNVTNSSVFLHNQSQKIKIEPNNSVNLDSLEKVIITLTHDYGSSAMSKKEIACDNADDSIVSLLIAPHKKPYFNVVLDCTYEVQCAQASAVYIKQETLRPVYTCSYDRLYPSVIDGTVREISHTFQERKEYEEHYQRAISGSNTKIINILLLLLAISSLPIIIISYLASFMIGLVVMLVICVALFFIRFFGMLFSRMISKADCSSVFSNFESNVIIDFFKKSRMKKTN